MYPEIPKPLVFDRSVRAPVAVPIASSVPQSILVEPPVRASIALAGVDALSRSNFTFWNIVMLPAVLLPLIVSVLPVPTILAPLRMPVTVVLPSSVTLLLFVAVAPEPPMTYPVTTAPVPSVISLSEAAPPVEIEPVILPTLPPVTFTLFAVALPAEYAPTTFAAEPPVMLTVLFVVVPVGAHV